MNNTTKKILSVLLSVLVLFGTVTVAFAAETTSVKLVSFMRGDVSDLRSSELLEVQVEGYDGNPRELTYKWTSSLGTYLYVYNSHNMYGINNSDGEMEIHNTKKNLTRLSNVPAERGFDQTFSGVGFAWAAVYGAYSKTSELSGTVTVEVLDKNGNSLGSDSFGKFTAHNLDKDLDNVVIGLFEGEEMNALDLLGRSGVVHITCTASTVTKAQILSGSGNISVEKRSGDYYVKGVAAGQAQLNITIKKENCKFHKNTSGTADPVVFVFQKPVTTTTTTTLTLVDKLDDRCEYFIDGNKGEKQPDGTVLFTGLTPNTKYTVEVRAEYEDNGKTKYVYGYVEDTTKPVYQATIKTYLDGVLADIPAIHGEDVALYLRDQDGKIADIPLEETSTGIYTATVENGIYLPLHIGHGDEEHVAREYKLIVQNANAELHLHHYSVKYDTNGGAFKDGEEVGTEIYSSMAAVDATENKPVREGYAFAGWEYNGATYAHGEQVTSAISAPITLKAKWEKEVNVTINVTVNHKADGGYDHDDNRDKVVVNFLEMKAGASAFIETGDVLNFAKDGVTDEKGNKKGYDVEEYEMGNVVLETKYTANAVTYAGLLETSTFGVALSKTGYDVESVTKTKDEAGNWKIDVKLVYNPNDFNLDFSVEMEEGTPKEFYPDAVIVKIACWDADAKEWLIISQQRSTALTTRPGVRVDIDPDTGKGAGSYPVWMYDEKNEAYGYRAVVTGFIYDGSTIIVPTEKDHIKDDGNVVITYTDGNYTATMGDIADGKKFSTSLNGAYYNDTTKAQQGTLHGVISVEKYDVIFDANGGVNAEGKDIAKQVYRVPVLDGYKPTMENHKFLGWYKDKECTVPAVENELLTENITLYAKWDKILTGTLIIDGAYVHNGEKVNVNDVDRAKQALVELEEITPDGTYNIAGKEVNIEWEEGKDYSKPVSYEFTNLDPDKTYRIDVYLINYDATYQNSTTVVDGDDEYIDDYNTTDFMAVYPESSKWETFVNAHLEFNPAPYFQPVEVDATLIGANSRPTDTLVEVLYKATGTDNAYKVITQHTVVPYGIEVGMSADGTDDGYYGYLVWKSLYDGSLYDYQANLTKLTKRVGEENVTTSLADWPVSVVYGEPSRYSPLNDAATGTLQVKLVPNRYGIIYHENYKLEDVEVVTYGTHVWSYETAVTYVPTREGYIFQGWYSNPECTGETVTAIAETVAQDTNLYAKWEPETGKELTVYHVEKLTGLVLETEIQSYSFDDEVTAESLKKEFKGFTYDSASPEFVKITKDKNEITLYYVRNNYGYTVNYLEEGTEKVLADAKAATAVYGSTVTEEAIAIEGYTYTGDGKTSITIDTENNVINFYYAVDNLGGGAGGNDSDGTPDKYQKKIIYKVVNGMWSDGTTEDIIQYVTLIKGGKYSVDGEAVITAPVGMIASVGYKNGAWDKEIPAVVTSEDADVLEFTYSFDRSTTSVEPLDGVSYIVEHYKENSDGTYSIVAADTEILAGKIGEIVTATAKVYEDYCLNVIKSEETANGVLKAINSANDIVTLKLYYDLDKLGGGEGGNEGDGTPDKYQKKVIFKVVNGTWEDDTTADKVVYLDLMKAGKYAADGTASLTAPTGMKANVGFENGSWIVDPPLSVSGTDDAEYTFVFVEKATEPEVPTDPSEPTDPTDPTEPVEPDIPEGDGEGEGNGTGNGSLNGGSHHILFGKTDGIGWYKVSKDGGKTFDIVFGNSTYEVEPGTELMISVGDLMGDAFTFYVNGNAIEPNEDGYLVITVNGYMLIGALGYKVDVPDIEESLNWFQKLIKAIKDFFAKIFGKK